MNGIPRQTDAGSTEWRSVAPLLDHRPEIRRFQLAGGIGTLPLVGRADFDTAVANWLKAYVPPSYAHSLVLLSSRSGWVLLDRAADLLRAAYPLRAEAGPGPEPSSGPGVPGAESAVDELLRTAPLLLDHTLLLARFDDRTGAVHPYTEVLFPAGSRLPAGGTATAAVTVHGGIEDGTPVLLPVLAGRPAADGTGAAVLSAPGTELHALGTARLTFELRGPGDVRLTGRAAPAENGRPALDIPALISGLPRRIIRPPGLEVWFTVELSGADTAETAERLDFVGEVVSELARRNGGAGLRVGVVGHYDHVIHENSHTQRPTLLLPRPAGPAGDVLAELAGWKPALRRQDTTSSLEDALKAVVRLAVAPARAAAATRRTVLIVARRPPAMPVLRGPVPSCPLGADWKHELHALRGHGVRVLTRADQTPPGPPGSPDPVGDYARGTWAALSAEGSFQPGRNAPADVAAELTPAWRSDGPPCPLAFATALR
ncbi:hypothetical protein [Streptomyces sp. RKAG337]|uniref:hypothetical protein n=1 Tax=Streptomyces sp. RKAG337 TaxID=2893404 RepID=UPI0020338913|nr:hypothetical protein [Streptomyces sp. RKAG337]MCM2430827.1 hypothetical protein [Streptomyces sp. RKAG337]